MQSLAFLFLRLTFGLGLAWHGYTSLFGPDSAAGMERLTGLIESHNWPAPEAFAYLAKITELAGGLLVAVGLLTRAAALACFGTMAVAIWMAHLDDPFLGGWESAALYGTVFLALVLTGGGKMSIDGLRSRNENADGTPKSAPSAAPSRQHEPPVPGYEISQPAGAPEAETPIQGSGAVWAGDEDDESAPRKRD